MNAQMIRQGKVNTHIYIYHWTHMVSLFVGLLAASITRYQSFSTRLLIPLIVVVYL